MSAALLRPFVLPLAKPLTGTIIAVLLALAGAPATAQTENAVEELSPVQLQQAVRDARIAKQSGAHQIAADMRALAPGIPGWRCVASEIPPVDMPVTAYRCAHEVHTLDVYFLANPAMAETTCRNIELKKAGIETGRVKPDLLRFFDGNGWTLQRASVDVSGCADGLFALIARGGRQDAQIAAGFQAVDDFASAWQSVDTSTLARSAPVAQYLEGETTLRTLLLAQSDRLSAHLPQADGATITPQSPRDLPATAIGADALPVAQASYDWAECHLNVSLSAAPRDLAELARSAPWARPGGTDGAGAHAYMRHNTARFRGQERKDGTGLDAVLSDGVIVRIHIPSRVPCASQPEIVATLFADILSRDLSAFAP